MLERLDSETFSIKRLNWNYDTLKFYGVILRHEQIFTTTTKYCKNYENVLFLTAINHMHFMSL